MLVLSWFPEGSKALWGLTARGTFHVAKKGTATGEDEVWYSPTGRGPHEESET